MSIMDVFGIFSDEQALTATADSETTLDFGAGADAWGAAKAAPELADGKPLWLNVMVQTELDSAGDAATLTVALATSTDNSSFSNKLATAAIAEASLIAGYCILAVPLPTGLSRYNKLIYTVGTENFTSGKISAWIGLEPYKAA